MGVRQERSLYNFGEFRKSEAPVEMGSLRGTKLLFKKNTSPPSSLNKRDKMRSLRGAEPLLRDLFPPSPFQGEGGLRGIGFYQINNPDKR
jgi:hypothetical protein